MRIYFGLACMLMQMFFFKKSSWNSLSLAVFLKYFMTHFKDTLRVFDDFKSKNKSAWSNAFWYVKVYIFWKFIQYNIYRDKTQMLRKFPLNKVKIKKRKKAPFFLLRAPTHHSFTSNFQFLYELKHKVCGIFHFRFRFF